MKKVFEGIAEFEMEDRGKALIAEVDDGKNPGLIVRLQSWDATMAHTEANKFANKKVRITVETLE